MCVDSVLTLVCSESAAISSYITSKHSLLFSVGGPTGEVHQLMPETGAIEEKLQDILFVPKEALDQEDKSHRALVRFFNRFVLLDTLS
jgi:hypothetical protein